jgi:hypothetical protein
VLSAGPTPHHPIDWLSFEIRGEIDEPKSWKWEEFMALPNERITVDIHCVTKWSKLDTSWRGVSLDTLLEGVDTSAEYVLAFSDGGYTTNLPLEDVRDGKAWVVYEYEDVLSAGWVRRFAWLLVVRRASLWEDVIRGKRPGRGGVCLPSCSFCGLGLKICVAARRAASLSLGRRRQPLRQF